VTGKGKGEREQPLFLIIHFDFGLVLVLGSGSMAVPRVGFIELCEFWLALFLTAGEPLTAN
jgi:hypothetical protein